MQEKVIVFDVWAPFAYFRKGFTTTTAITFPFIPRSAVEGLIGAILGLDSDEYSERLNDARIAVGIVNKISKMPFAMMHTHVDAWKPPSKNIKLENFRARVKVEFLHDPKFRIYFNHDLDTQNDLKNKLLGHETVFTPYLGTSSMIANFEYLGEYLCSQIPKAVVPISSIIPFIDRMPEISLEDGAVYAIEQNIPAHIKADRTVTRTYSAIYSPYGTKIKASGLEAHALNRGTGYENVVFIPT